MGNIMVMCKDGVLIVKFVDLELVESMVDEYELCDYIVSIVFIINVCLIERFCLGYIWFYS